MRNLLLILLNITGVFLLKAQDKHVPEILERNNIKEIEAYIFEEMNKSDSFLITKEYFNAKGRITKVEVYDTTGIRSEYIYIYLYDTLRIERITKFDGKFSSRTKIYYDKKNREIKAIDYDLKGKKTGTYSTTKYNDRKLTKESKTYFSNKLYVRTKDNFDKNNTQKEYSVKRNGKWIHQLYREGIFPNFSKEEIENYQNSGLKMVREKKIFDRNVTILGIKGKLKLLINDILVNERLINKNGLIEYEKQYLNDILIGIKKYKYVS